MSTGRIFALVDTLHHCWKQDVSNQCALTAARNTRDCNETAKRNIYIEILQVVLASSANSNHITRRCTSRLWDWNNHFSGDVFARHRVFCFGYACYWTAVDDFATVFSGTWPDINNPVRFLDGVFVVLHHKNRVSQITQTNQRVNKSTIISLMQTDTWLVQHVQRAHKTRANLASQTDALCFTASQCSGGARQREIVQAHVKKET